MPTIILVLIPLCGFVAYCMCRHFQHTKEFNPLWFDLTPEQQEAEKQAAKPSYNHLKISWPDWLLPIDIIGLLSFMVYVICNTI